MAGRRTQPLNPATGASTANRTGAAPRRAVRKPVFARLVNACLLAALLFSSVHCTRRDLETPPEESAVNITFDWKNLHPDESTPAGMRLYFYKDDGSAIMTASCDGTAFSGTLVFGAYHVLAYNADADGVAYRNLDTYAGAQIYAPSWTKAAYISQPLHAYGIGLESLTVSEGSETSAVMTPASLVKKVLLEVTFTGEASAVSSCDLTLDGIVQAVTLATGELAQETGTIAVTPTLTGSGFETLFTFFGKAPSVRNLLKLELGFTGGASQQLTLDLTTALENVNQVSAPVQVEAEIEISATAEGRFSASVLHWTDIPGGSTEVN